MTELPPATVIAGVEVVAASAAGMPGPNAAAAARPTAAPAPASILARTRAMTARRADLTVFSAWFIVRSLVLARAGSGARVSPRTTKILRRSPTWLGGGPR